MSTHDPCHVANFFIQKGLDDGQPFIPIQVNKFVYFSHAFMLGIHGRPLVNRALEAWLYGPVTPVVYHCLSYYGGNPVLAPILAHQQEFDEDELDVLTQVLQTYGPLIPTQLTLITAVPGGPWDQTRRKANTPFSPIPDNLVQTYYSQIAQGKQPVKDPKPFQRAIDALTLRRQQCLPSK